MNETNPSEVKYPFLNVVEKFTLQVRTVGFRCEPINRLFHHFLQLTLITLLDTNMSDSKSIYIFQIWTHSIQIVYSTDNHYTDNEY